MSNPEEQPPNTPTAGAGLLRSAMCRSLAMTVLNGEFSSRLTSRYVSSGSSWLLTALLIGLLCMFTALRASALILRVLGTMGILSWKKSWGFSLRVLRSSLSITASCLWASSGPNAPQKTPDPSP